MSLAGLEKARPDLNGEAERFLLSDLRHAFAAVLLLRVFGLLALFACAVALWR